ncbi:MAG TPA: class I SAM-dependent methyltransferase [Planctomycetota bacterium]|nr:class I SAM-dependent methyltransferase [Planctomycetota bacterium]
MRRKPLMAATADRYDLYERTVQEPDAECDLVEQVWDELKGRRPRTLREDFCGTAITAIAWVRRRPRNRAVAIDLSPDVLAVAEQRVRKRLKPAARRRIRLVRGDVLRARTAPVDTVVASNFSYFTFKTRPLLRRYFRACHRAVARGGMLLLDAYGGSDAWREIREPRKEKGYTYIWEQHHVNPVTAHVVNHIHFRFPDGSRLRRAFTYDWRLWTLPELTEVLHEAGFRKVTVYWEGTDRNGEGNGVFSRTEKGEACEGWVAYLAAEK